MAEESWNEARLIPTSGINGSDEAERRATSALLAVMGAVKEFGRTLVQPLGAPAGALLTYIEVPFEVAERKVYPDGLLRVSRGQKTWTALVEVKTGTNDLQRDQLETYLEIARAQGYQCLITVSNQIPPAPGVHPTVVDKRLLRKVELHHWSWSQVLHAAVMQKEHRGVADPDQAWILGELIRYLEHPRSGALEFDDMGSAWVGVREAVSSGTLRRSDKGLADTTAKFEALLRFTSLRLGRSLGTEVTPALSRREQNEPALRAQQLADSLVASGTLDGGIRVPGAVAPLAVEVDLRSGRITCSVDLEAPREGRQLTRVNWLLRQLKHAPDDVRVEASSARSRGPGAVGLLSTVRADPATLVEDPQRDLRSFRISRTTPMGTKRGRGRGSFIDSVIAAVEDFYGDVVQHLKAWSAAPPRLREAVEELPTQSALDSNALSSQDGTDEVEDDSPEPELHHEPAASVD